MSRGRPHPEGPSRPFRLRPWGGLKAQRAALRAAAAATVPDPSVLIIGAGVHPRKRARLREPSRLTKFGSILAETVTNLSLPRAWPLLPQNAVMLVVLDAHP